jgi:hypothetical protein
MANLNNIDKLKLEKFLEMGSGYVLDFNNRSFADFIYTSTKKGIWEPKYASNSGSKANRLRAFWDYEGDQTVGKLLQDLLEYWKTQKLLSNVAATENQQLIYKECELIVNKLLGQKSNNNSPNLYTTEDEFINKDFKEISIDKLKLDGVITEVLKQRMEEIRKCLNAKAPLATIFLCGSTLEGILLGVATNRPKEFNTAASSPKDKVTGKVLSLNNWTLSNLIDVSCALKLVGEDVKKFSHALRDFRNYIHPYQQMSSGFNPDDHTAKICWQVLQTAIYQLTKSPN